MKSIMGFAVTTLLCLSFTTTRAATMADMPAGSGFNGGQAGDVVAGMPVAGPVDESPGNSLRGAVLLLKGTAGENAGKNVEDIAEKDFVPVEGVFASVTMIDSKGVNALAFNGSSNLHGLVAEIVTYKPQPYKVGDTFTVTVHVDGLGEKQYQGVVKRGVFGLDVLVVVYLGDLK